MSSSELSVVFVSACELSRSSETVFAMRGMLGVYTNDIITPAGESKRRYNGRHQQFVSEEITPESTDLRTNTRQNFDFGRAA